MKKIFLALSFLLAACNSPENFKVGTYKMVNSPNDVPITMSFSKDNNLNAKVVNIIMGQYEIKDSSITIIPGGTTMMMGPEKEMEAEQIFMQMLLAVKSYKMRGTQLELITEDGKSLMFNFVKE